MATGTGSSPSSACGTKRGRGECESSLSSSLDSSALSSSIISMSMAMMGGGGGNGGGSHGEDDALLDSMLNLPTQNEKESSVKRARVEVAGNGQGVIYSI